MERDTGVDWIHDRGHEDPFGRGGVLPPFHLQHYIPLSHLLALIRTQWRWTENYVRIRACASIIWVSGKCPVNRRVEYISINSESQAATTQWMYWLIWLLCFGTNPNLKQGRSNQIQNQIPSVIQSENRGLQSLNVKLVREKTQAADPAGTHTHTHTLSSCSV